MIRFESLRETCQAFIDAENAPIGISINETDSGTHIDTQDHGLFIPEEVGLALDMVFESFYHKD